MLENRSLQLAKMYLLNFRKMEDIRDQIEEGSYSPKPVQERTPVMVRVAPRMLLAENLVTFRGLGSSLPGQLIGWSVGVLQQKSSGLLTICNLPLPCLYHSQAMSNPYVCPLRQEQWVRGWVGPLVAVTCRWISELPHQEITELLSWGTAHTVPHPGHRRQARGHTAQNGMSGSLPQAG